MKKRLIIIITIFFMFFCALLLTNKNTILSVFNGQKKNVGIGYDLSLIQGDGNLSDFSKEISANVGSDEKIDCKVKFINRSGKNNIFLLKLNINYLDVDFFIDNNEKIINSYKFDLKVGCEKIINVKVAANVFIYNINPIVINIVAAPDKHAADMNFITDSFGISARYDLINKKVLSDSSKYPVPEEVSSLNTIKLTQDNNGIKVFLNQFSDESNNFICPPVKLDVQPEQVIELGLRAGNVLDTNRYIVWLTLDHNQILINNKPYWYFNVGKSRVAYTKIKIKAPKEKGKYELYARMAPNPWTSMKTKSILQMYIESSFRITMNVE